MLMSQRCFRSRVKEVSARRKCTWRLSKEEKEEEKAAVEEEEEGVLANTIYGCVEYDQI